MSKLKAQLKKIVPRLSKEANKLRDNEARSRWMKLVRVVMSPKSIARACADAGWSEDSFNKWGLRLRKQPRFESLHSKSRKPYRSPNRTKPRIERKILGLRRAEPSYGPDRLSNDAKTIYRLHVPASTVYAILRRAKLVARKLAQKLTKKHLKRYRQPFPGYLQMDFKYVPYKINGCQFYQLSCVDHHSSWRLIRCYRAKDIAVVINFLNKLMARCPFPIIEIQTDNDAAFTDKFTSRRGVTGEHLMDQWCKARGIEHRLIPVGVKELNGKVENTHKQDDREFYAKGPYRDFASIRLNTRGYNQRWNLLRRTRSLGFKSPEEVVTEAYVRAIAYLKTIQELYEPDKKMTEEQLPIEPVKIRTRKLRRVQQYLKYLEWVDKKNMKAIIFTPAMSPNYSIIIIICHCNSRIIIIKIFGSREL